MHTIITRYDFVHVAMSLCKFYTVIRFVHFLSLSESRINEKVTFTGHADGKIVIAHVQDHGIRILSVKSNPHFIFTHRVSC